MTLRPIDIPETPPHALADQPAPQLMWVDLADLRLYDVYQRPVAARAVGRIAADFRWSRFSPVLVAPIEGGGFAVVDGQHRAHAAALCGIAKLPAMVVPMSQAQQADAFRHVNGAVTRVTPYQMWRAARAAGEPWAEAVGRAVEAAGCRITSNMGGHQRKPRTVSQVGLIRRYIDAGLEELVTTGLRALARAEATRDAPEAWTGPVIRSWLDALGMSQHNLRADLEGFLAEIDLASEYQEAVADVRTNPRMGGAIPLATARVATALHEFRRQAA